MYQGIIAIKDKQWYVDITATYQEVTQGLGGVASIPEGTGMFFDAGGYHFALTTHPMLFSIDIAFISDELVITQIERDVPPGELIYPDPQARLWLEVNAGELADMEVGNEVSVELLSAPIIQPDILTYVMPIMVIGMMGAIGVGFAKAITAPSAKAAVIPPSRALIATQQYPYERRVRKELRKLPTDKLKLVYNGLIAGFPSHDIPLLNEDKEVSARIAKEILWERGKMPKYYADTADDVEKHGYMFQTQLDTVFVEAIERAKKLYGEQM